MKNKRILLALLALALALTTALPAAMAYFTANAQADGGRPIRLGGSTTIEEVLVGWEKQATITAAADSQPMWVRARAYSSYELKITAGAGWKQAEPDDGWYYFSTPLSANAAGNGPIPDTGSVQAADPFTVAIKDQPVAEVGKLPEDFDVVIVYETTPVQYDEKGNATGPTEESVWDTELQNFGAAQGGGTAE